MIIFLMVARVLYDKGYAEYVEAARVVKKEYSNVEFQLLGNIDTTYPKSVPIEVVQKEQEIGTIKYLGFAEDIRPFMQAADCIVLPSYHEGMSRVLMEALAMRKPIITSDIPGCRETVDDGKNGFLVPPRDVGKLIMACKQFLSLSEIERLNMGIYSRKKAELEFDVQKVIAIYRQITG